MIRSCSPGWSSVVTVSRARSGWLSMSVSVPAGPSTMWSMALASRILLWRVECSNPARSSWCPCISASSGAASAAAARGSPSCSGTGWFATSSDCATIRAGSPTGSITTSNAATDRCVKETSRVELTRTCRPDGARHSSSRRSTPSRRSKAREWLTISP